MPSISADPSGGRLFVVATPIGNLDDITLRAIRVLRECDVIFAEDTRRTRVLAKHLGIETPIERLDEHTMRSRLDETVQRLRAGLRAALVSDAGTPMVSDPGSVLVRACAEIGVVVEPVPGASAVLAALAASGLAEHGFRFVGFLPRSGPERSAELSAIARDPLPTVLFESAVRADKTLEDLGRACGDHRPCVLARELTKLHESILRGSVGSLAGEAAQGLRGEVTIVVAGAAERGETPDLGDGVDAALDAAFAAGMRPAEAARDVARALGLKRADVYALAIRKRGA